MRAVPERETQGTTGREADLRQLLEERRRELRTDLRERVKDVRSKATSSAAVDVVDSAESAEADIQDDLHFSLMQMKAETLERIEHALIRLGSGHYGRCVDCDEEIAERRLRALPFALRCTECEHAREIRIRELQKAPQPSFGSLFERH